MGAHAGAQRSIAFAVQMARRRARRRSGRGSRGISRGSLAIAPGARTIGLIRSGAMLKLRSTGRGGKYSVARGLVESAQSLLYLGGWPAWLLDQWGEDRKSTRLNSSHSQISYAVFCLKKKKL